jgi:hypothetical protein
MRVPLFAFIKWLREKTRSCQLKIVPPVSTLDSILRDDWYLAKSKKKQNEDQIPH